MAASAADIASDITPELGAAGSNSTQDKGETFIRHPVRRLADLFSGTRQLPWRIIMLSAAVGILNLALPLVLLLIFNRAGNDRAVYAVFAIVAALFGVVAAGMLLRRVRNRLLGDFAAGENFQLQMRAARRLLNIISPAAVRLPASAASDALQAIDELSYYNGSHARLAALELPFLTVYLVATGIIGGLIVAVPTVLAMLFIIWMLQSRAATQPFALEVAEHDRKRFDFYAESIGALTTVKALAVEPRLQRRHESHIQGGAAAGEAIILQNMRLNDFGHHFETVIFLPVVVTGCLMAVEGALSVGAVAFCSLIAILIARSTRRIVWGMDQYGAAEMAQERAKVVLGLPEHAADLSGMTGPAKVQFNGIRMDASEASPDGERGVNLTIRPGEVIGIIIRDENRRRTVSDILRGRSEPDHGEYLIDGRKVSAQLPALQRVVFVDDEPAIFHGTIMENMSMCGAMNPATAVEMARRMEVEPEILKLPDGYHTKLTSDGTPHLSRDMLLAITLVRVAAIRPGLLILDVHPSTLSGIAARAYEKMIGELRGSVTIVALGRTLIESVADGRSYRMKNWSLEPVDTVIHAGDDTPEEPEAAKDD